MGYQSRPMIAYTFIVIGVLSVPQCSFSLNLDCAKLTTSCPTAAQWSEREKIFNCPGKKRYICLMAPENELREGCIFNYTIQARQIGCPYTKECDIRTRQPVLVTPNNYLPCPAELNGCPPSNHSGYSILEIYKYERCQGRNVSDRSVVAPDEVTGTPTTIAPDTIIQHGIWALNTAFIAPGLLFIFFVIYVVFKEKYKGRSDKNSKKNDEPHMQHSSNFSDSHIYQTPLLSDKGQQASEMRQQTSQLSHKQHPEPSFRYSEVCFWPKCTRYQTGRPGASLIDFNFSQESESISLNETQLHKAASNGDIETVKELIDGKADVNAKTFFQDTPLHEAASNGHIDIVKILIDAKADINAKELDLDTPLHKAAKHGHSDIVKILIDAKADVNAKGGFQDSPLHKAVSTGHIDIVKILIDARADVSAKARFQDAPLHIAASNGHSDTVKILIDAKANVNAMDSHQDTPLHKAIKNGHIDIVRILIDAKANVNAHVRYQDTPLHKAAKHGHIDIVKILIDAKANVNDKGGNRKTPLHLAVEFNKSDIVKILLNAGADANAEDKNGKTPMSLAEESAKTDIIKAFSSVIPK